MIDFSVLKFCITICYNLEGKERKDGKMKHIISTVLVIVLVLSSISFAFAASEDVDYQADFLNHLGIFSGTGTDSLGNPNYELNRTPTRYEAVAMLVRLLGKEIEAEEGEWEIPFNDVAAWARPYVGYAYAKGLTSGISDTSFGGKSSVNSAQYLTFILGALGYSTPKDFQWNKAWELSDQLGITLNRFDKDTKNFTRGDIVFISYNSMYVKSKGDNKTLFNKLKAEGAISSDADINADYDTLFLSKSLRDIEGLDIESLEAFKLKTGYKFKLTYSSDRNRESCIFYSGRQSPDYDNYGNYSFGLVPGEDNILTFSIPEDSIAIKNGRMVMRFNNGEWVDRINDSIYFTVR